VRRVIPRSSRRRGRFGAIAQLGERVNGIHEVSGSIPLGSTNRPCLASFACDCSGLDGSVQPSAYPVKYPACVPQIGARVPLRRLRRDRVACPFPDVPTGKSEIPSTGSREPRFPIGGATVACGRPRVGQHGQARGWARWTARAHYAGGPGSGSRGGDLVTFTRPGTTPRQLHGLRPPAAVRVASRIHLPAGQNGRPTSLPYSARIEPT
jgi:hypothetical protein